MTTSSVPARVAAEAELAEQEARAGLAALAAAAAPPAQDPPAPAPAQDPPAPTPPAPSATPVPDLNAIVARQQAQLDSVLGRQQQLIDQNAALQRELAAARTQPAAPPAAPVASYTPTATEVKEYGEDLIDLITRIATGVAVARGAEMSTRVAQLEGRIGNVQQTTQQVQQTAQEMAFGRYMAALDADIPGWKAVNDDPGFLTWLAEKDGFSGKTRHELLAAAHEALDAGRVAAIFTAYKPDLRTAPPAAPAPQTPPAPAAPHIDPATLAAPPTAPAAPPPATPPAGRLWKQSEVDKLYEDKQKGRISAQLFEVEEREYMKALSEGRVIADQ
jgi:hypothetical protein